MATITRSSTFYWYNSGWNTGTIGTHAGYISTKSNGRIVI
jgi:hypothetical protein